MSKKAIFFIEYNGTKKYKCDTFWSMSDILTHAKIHDNSDRNISDYLKSLIYQLNEFMKDTRHGLGEAMSFIYGHQTFSNDQLVDPLAMYGSLKENPIFDETVYTHLLEKDEDGLFRAIDYKYIKREETLTKILDESIRDVANRMFLQSKVMDPDVCDLFNRKFWDSIE